MFTFHIAILVTSMYFFIYLATCEDPTPVNGQINAIESPVTTRFYSVGTNVSFSCDSEYELFGSSASSCNGSGFWNPPAPTCRQGDETNDILISIK